jgi:hypothetical protein
VLPEKTELQVQLEQPGQQDWMVQQEQPEPLVLQVKMVLQVLLALREPQELQV